MHPSYGKKRSAIGNFFFHASPHFKIKFAFIVKIRIIVLIFRGKNGRIKIQQLSFGEIL